MTQIALQASRTPWSFSRQFLAVGVGFFLLGMLATGSWLGRQLEASAVNRAAAIVAAYTESILTTELAGTSFDGGLAGSAVRRLDEIFVEGPLRKKVVRFKLWGADGTVMYSSDPLQRGARFPVGGMLAAAFAGNVRARLTDLDQPDNAPERERWPQLLEVYVPLRIGRDSVASEDVNGVAEFYHSTDGLAREIRAAQAHGWQVIGAASLVICLLLWALFRRADETIVDQAHDLRLQLTQLRSALDENERMRGEVSAAGARTTALNEELLHRIAADIHDGPAQKIAYALMRFDDENDGAAADGGDRRTSEAIRVALRTALEDIRDIASGLGLPLVESLSLSETVQRAVRDSQRQFGLVARIEAGQEIGDAPLAVKITAYRFIQESLNNARIHAPGSTPVVRVWREGDDAWLEVADQGQGFDAAEPQRAGRLGLAFLRERVRLLGGSFALDTAPGSGTTLRARLPITNEHLR